MNQECLRDIESFAGGGYAGWGSLQRVMSSIFKYYGITDPADQIELIDAAGLTPVQDRHGGINIQIVISDVCV